MLRLLLHGLLALLLISSAEAAPRVVRLTNGEWPPFMSNKLPGGGILSRIVAEAFRSVGITVQYTYFPWVRAYEEAKDGHYDGSVGWAPNPERLRWFDYSEVVITADMVFFQRKNHSVRWNTLSDLAPYRIGTTRGDYYSDEFAALQKAGKLKVDESATNEEDNFHKLLRGRIDLFPIERHVGLYLLNLHFPAWARDQLAQDRKPFWVAPLHLVIGHATPQRQELLALFNQGLAKLKASGRYQALVEEGLTAHPPAESRSLP
jgi:polar amino acid transport system substrate-binding protein